MCLFLNVYWFDHTQWKLNFLNINNTNNYIYIYAYIHISTVPLHNAAGSVHAINCDPYKEQESTCIGFLLRGSICQCNRLLKCPNPPSPVVLRFEYFSVCTDSLGLLLMVPYKVAALRTTIIGGGHSTKVS